MLRIFKKILFSLAAFGMLFVQSPLSAHETETLESPTPYRRAPQVIKNPFDSFGSSRCTKGWKAKFHDWKEDNHMTRWITRLKEWKEKNPKTYARLRYIAIGSGVGGLIITIGVAFPPITIPFICLGTGLFGGSVYSALMIGVKTPQMRQTEKDMQQRQELKISIDRNNLLRMLELKKDGILGVPTPTP